MSLPVLSPEETLDGADHVAFHSSHPELTRHAARHPAAGLAAGEPAMVLASPSRVRSIDAEMAGLVRHAPLRGRRLHVYGELVGLLWDAGHLAAAVELEELWNELRTSLPLSLFCAYRVDPLMGEVEDRHLEETHRRHNEVIGAPPAGSGRLRGGRQASREARGEFQATPRGPTEARHFVTTQLAEWGCGELLDRAALVVTELATNSLVHARSAFTVTLTALPDVIHISVTDSSAAPPRRRSPDPLASSGRGLALVAAEATRWGSELRAGSKVVWAEIAR